MVVGLGVAAMSLRKTMFAICKSWGKCLMSTHNEDFVAMLWMQHVKYWCRLLLHDCAIRQTS